MNDYRPNPIRSNRQVVIAMGDRDRLMRLSVALSHVPYEVTALLTPDAVAAALAYTRDGVAAMIVALDGRETTVDIRALLESRPDAAFVLLVAQMPPTAAVARVANASGAAILPADEAGIVVAATLISMFARESAVR